MSKDDFLSQYEDSLKKELEEYKKGLGLQLNQFLLDKINEAEQAIEKSKKRYIEQLEKDFKYIEEERNVSDDFMKETLDIMEKSIKDDFERGMRITVKMWKGFIENCKSQMKQEK